MLQFPELRTMTLHLLTVYLNFYYYFFTFAIFFNNFLEGFNFSLQNFMNGEQMKYKKLMLLLITFPPFADIPQRCLWETPFATSPE